jgi:hypothetical protein
MPALQVRDPVEPFILMKSDDLPVQNASFGRFKTEPARVSAELRDVSEEFRNVSAGLGNVAEELRRVAAEPRQVAERHREVAEEPRRVAERPGTVTAERRNVAGERGKAGGLQKNSGESRGKTGDEPDRGSTLEKNLPALRRKAGGRRDYSPSSSFFS